MHTFCAGNSVSAAISKQSRPPSGKQIQHTVYPFHQTVGQVHPLPLRETVTKLRDHFPPAFWPLLRSPSAQAPAQQSVTMCGTCQQGTMYLERYETGLNCFTCENYGGEACIGGFAGTKRICMPAVVGSRAGLGRARDRSVI